MKLGPYQVHPVAADFPLMQPDELKRLADDIKHQGQQQPIIPTHSQNGSTLVDGRNRYRALHELLAIEAIHTKLGEYYTDDMIRDYIVSANAKRRDLTSGPARHDRRQARADLRESPQRERASAQGR